MAAVEVTASVGQQQGQYGAALGTLWAHSVNLRMVLERTGDRRFIKVVVGRAFKAADFEVCLGLPATTLHVLSQCGDRELERGIPIDMVLPRWKLLRQESLDPRSPKD